MPSVRMMYSYHATSPTHRGTLIVHRCGEDETQTLCNRPTSDLVRVSRKEALKKRNHECSVCKELVADLRSLGEMLAG